MQFLTSISIILVLCMMMMISVNSYGEGSCMCHSSYQWTRDCCGPTGGYFIHRKCYNTFGLSFIQCCRYAGLRGACIA
ncbi:unnamed protein product [Adineta steineri]|uniref:Uncharacterized protein n=1 Tax=Adineta steineri TaxID=433720 RepID=A0A815ZDE6_9BILA|nr:unnamed protein product [Adineta steineri]CAF1581348.1 unnamed protein product [Adineta steineri]